MKSRREFAPTALVVDDEVALTTLMRKMLEGGGFRVLTANNGADAVTIFRTAEIPIDLLITDYTMPGMTGVELARECRNVNSETAVLYVSGSSPKDDLLSDLQTGRPSFLAKPFRKSDLLRSAKALLGAEESSVARACETDFMGGLDCLNMETQS
jgi:two-component system cell cycle sensor histidine kinase/response regulator CckA